MSDSWEFTSGYWREARNIDVEGEILCRKSRTDGVWYVVRAKGVGWELSGRAKVSPELAAVLEAGKPA